MNIRKGSRPVIWIAAALIDDPDGRLFLVRKQGTEKFMQPGGKIEGEEAPIAALCRELVEELGLAIDPEVPKYLGTFTSPAANEPDHLVKAELFHIRLSGGSLTAGAEIVDAIWTTASQANALPLAPLTQNHVLPLLHQLAARPT